MARKSYGADLFSPLRSDSSLEEVSITSRESDVFNELYQDIKKQDSKKVKKRSSSKKSLKLLADDDLKSTVRSSQSLFDEVDPKISSKEHSINPAFITTRKRSSVQNSTANETFKIPTSTVNSSKSLRKAKSSTEIALKSDSIKRNNDVNNRIRKSSSSNRSSTLPSVTEEPATPVFPIADSEIDYQTSSLNSLQNKENKSPKTVRPQIGENISLGYISEPASDVIRRIDSDQNFSQPKADLNDKNITEQGATDVSETKESSSSTAQSTQTPLSIITQALCENCGNMNTIQASLVEKLVKETVSSELDGIRQMLYLQQLSLMKHTAKHFMTVNENVTDAGVFIKIIEQLMEENRQLKNIIASHKT